MTDIFLAGGNARLHRHSEEKIYCDQEKMRGQRGRLPVQALGYVMSTKVIFRPAEVCLPRRPHAGQPRSDV